MTFEEILENYNVPIAPEGHRHGRIGWIQFDCPFCGEGSDKYHMGYNTSSGYVNCWSCGYHSIYKVLQILTGLQGADLKELITNLPLSQARREPTPTGWFNPPMGLQERLLKIHREYLAGRGFQPHKLQRLWKLGSIAMSLELKYSWSIFIPIRNKSYCASWTTRYIGHNPSVPRYNSSPSNRESLPAKSLLYGEEYAQFSIVICEGPTDVWRIGPGAVATLGTNYTPEQVKRMLHYPIRAICFDNAAQKMARKLYGELVAFPGETYQIQIDSNDPGCATNKEIATIRRIAELD
jgi:hypothetical protein